MRIALISDVHSNYEALTSVLSTGHDLGIDKYICLGDVVGYGADPNPCCDLIRRMASVTIMGNHDAAVIGMMDTEYYYPAARDAITWTRNALTDENFEWLYSLPYSYRRPKDEPEHNMAFYHAAPIIPSGFFYVVRQEDAQLHMKMYDRLAEFNFLGHSHLTNQYLLGPKRTKDVSGKPVKTRPDHKWIINVGSVGQPRDRDNRACFGLFDTDEQTFKHVRVEYNIDNTAKKIVDAGLDEKFARRLFSGL
jgi:predicted phosphodiesterase